MERKQDQARQTEDRISLAERVAAMTPDEISRIVRGLGRSTIIGRQENGLPITEASLIMDEILRQQNSARAEQEAA
ncbi:MAG TPA: hypothetical protein VFP35_00575 [Candidatus Saccharimonadales bacterium]|nr:hypothetical protein [Candidatus Saccharimonadales bacterium]